MTVVYYALGENEVKLFKADANGATSDKPAPALANIGIRFDTPTQQLAVDSVSNMMYLKLVLQRAPGWNCGPSLSVFDTVEHAPGGLCNAGFAGISLPENPHTAELLGGGVSKGWAQNVTLAYAGEDGEVRIMKADLPIKVPPPPQ